MSETGDDEDSEYADRVGIELMRIFGDQLESTPPFFMLLPLVNEAEAYAFLSTVPAGTSPAEFSQLAHAFRAAHPLRVRTDEPEDEPPEAAV